MNYLKKQINKATTYTKAEITSIVLFLLFVIIKLYEVITIILNELKRKLMILFISIKIMIHLFILSFSSGIIGRLIYFKLINTIHLLNLPIKKFNSFTIIYWCRVYSNWNNHINIYHLCDKTSWK